MPDREKYIEVLSKTVKTVKEYNEDAPIKISLECIEDILELLKEQESIKPTINEDGEAYCICGENVGIIPNSKNLPKIRSKYCPGCGRRMKWE